MGEAKNIYFTCLNSPPLLGNWFCLQQQCLLKQPFLQTTSHSPSLNPFILVRRIWFDSFRGTTWTKKMPWTPGTNCRQNYPPECEAGVNKQINMELLRQLRLHLDGVLFRAGRRRIAWIP